MIMFWSSQLRINATTHEDHEMIALELHVSNDTLKITHRAHILLNYQKKPLRCRRRFGTRERACGLYCKGHVVHLVQLACGVERTRKIMQCIAEGPQRYIISSHREFDEIITRANSIKVVAFSMIQIT